jgi:uncharacterized membrane protein
MNLHVIFVHFPVALLTVYGVLELAHFRRLRALPYWFYLKGAFLILGELGALAAFFTGDAAERALRGNSAIRPLIDTHSTFGALTAAFFGLLALLYLAAWFGRARRSDRLTGAVERFLASSWMPVFGIIGLALITITGALGGAIAFGPDVDPLSKVIYGWFFPF